MLVRAEVALTVLPALQQLHLRGLKWDGLCAELQSGSVTPHTHP